MPVQVFTPYQGKIIDTHSQLGDEVKKGQTLFTIDSPDLLQAESTLIASAGVLAAADPDAGEGQASSCKPVAALRRMSIRPPPISRPPKALTRPRVMRCGFSARPTPRSTGSGRPQGRFDPDRALPDLRPDHCPQRGAGSVRAARQCAGAVHGRRLSTMWMLANVPETDAPAYQLGQAVEVRVLAFPDEVFRAMSHDSARWSTRTPAACWSAPRSTIRSTSSAPACSRLSVIRDAPVRAIRRGPGGRRGARRRRHDDRLGHHRPPSLHQTGRQDRHAARWIAPDSRWACRGELVATEGARSSSATCSPMRPRRAPVIAAP